MKNPPQKQLKVILIGDSCQDEYHYGSIERISPEAPVPVFVEKYIEHKKGMAENVKANLENLGIQVQSYFGDPSTKIRMIDEKSKQHIIRIDKDVQSSSLPITTQFNFDVDAIVISDYNKGFVSAELINFMLTKNIPVFLDTKKTDLSQFKNAIIKINQTEFVQAKTLPDDIIVTLGEQGVRYKDQIYSAPKLEITDVCGAGDTFLAALVYQYLQTQNMQVAIKFAIQAASITIQHVGVYAPTLKEISWQD